MTYTHDFGYHYESPYTFSTYYVEPVWIPFCYEDWTWQSLSSWASDALAGMSGPDAWHTPWRFVPTASETPSVLSSWPQIIGSYQSATMALHPEKSAARKAAAVDAVTQMWSAGKVTNSASASTPR